MGVKGVIKKIVFGGPEHQARKADEKIMKAEARKAEMSAMKEGMIAGARKKGYRKGLAKGSGQGGIMGSLAAGARAFEVGGKALVGDVDFGGIGKGLSMDFGTEPKRRRHRKPRSHCKPRRR